MAVILTTEEQAKVDGKKQDPKPSYFNAELGVDTPISDDFEAFIILSEQSLKDSTVEWINKSVNPQQQANTDRSDLMKAAMQQEIDNATATISELDSALHDFDEVRNKYSTGKFEAVPEIGLMLRDLQFTVDELLSNRDIAKHLLVMNTVLKSNLELQGRSEAEQQETSSWRTPMLAY